MKRICAECKEVLEHCVEGTEGDDRISHGLCPECAKNARMEIEKWRGNINGIYQEKSKQ
jgi:hypothetical protein